MLTPVFGYSVQNLYITMNWVYMSLQKNHWSIVTANKRPPWDSVHPTSVVLGIFKRFIFTIKNNYIYVCIVRHIHAICVQLLADSAHDKLYPWDQHLYVSIVLKKTKVVLLGEGGGKGLDFRISVTSSRLTYCFVVEHVVIFAAVKLCDVRLFERKKKTFPEKCTID